MALRLIVSVSRSRIHDALLFAGLLRASRIYSPRSRGASAEGDALDLSIYPDQMELNGLLEDHTIFFETFFTDYISK